MAEQKHMRLLPPGRARESQPSTGGRWSPQIKKRENVSQQRTYQKWGLFEVVSKGRVKLLINFRILQVWIVCTFVRAHRKNRIWGCNFQTQEEKRLAVETAESMKSNQESRQNYVKHWTNENHSINWQVYHQIEQLY